MVFEEPKNILNCAAIENGQGESFRVSRINKVVAKDQADGVSAPSSSPPPVPESGAVSPAQDAKQERVVSSLYANTDIPAQDNKQGRGASALYAQTDVYAEAAEGDVAEVSYVNPVAALDL